MIGNIRRNNKKISRIVVVALILFISLGYALLSHNFRINGNSKLANSKWDIHFDNVVLNDGNVELKEGDSNASIDEDDSTKVNFTVTLDI